MGGINFMDSFRKIKRLKTIGLSFAVVGSLVVGYLVVAPFEPMVKYEVYSKNNPMTTSTDVVIEEKQSSVAAQNVQKILAGFTDEASAATIKPVTKATSTVKKPTTVKLDNRLVIKTIGVNAHISNNKIASKGLNEGVWMDPSGSTPDKGSNTVIAGHRWKYLPPNNTTFYLLDKVKIGDSISVTWQNKKYAYTVKDIKIVDSNDTALLQPTAKPTLTVYTCTPIYSTKHRLVLIAEPEVF